MEKAVACEEDGRMKLNVGGTNFMTRRSTLQKLPGTRLASLTTSSEHFDSKDETFYFDRDPEIFGYILNAYRSDWLHVPRHVCPTFVIKELDYWKIPLAKLAECCWQVIYQHDSAMETIQKLKARTNTTYSNTEESKRKLKMLGFRQRLWVFLEEPNTSTAAKVWHLTYGFVVVLSAFIFVLWTQPDMRVEPYLSNPMPPEIILLIQNQTDVTFKVLSIITKDPHIVLLSLDIVCTVFFLLELILHVWSSPTKWAFFKNVYNVLNIILVVSMCLSLTLELLKDQYYTIEFVGYMFYVSKCFNVLRLLLLFKLSKLYNGLKVVLLAMEESLKELALLALSYCIAVVIFGGMIYCAEIGETSFSSVFQAMWWALITMTTVGYGDFYPTGPAGYLVGCLCATSGLVILALPIAIIASNFASVYQRNNDMQRHLATVSRQSAGMLLGEEKETGEGENAPKAERQPDDIRAPPEKTRPCWE